MRLEDVGPGDFSEELNFLFEEHEISLFFSGKAWEHRLLVYLIPILHRYAIRMWQCVPETQMRS